MDLAAIGTDAFASLPMDVYCENVFAIPNSVFTKYDFALLMLVVTGLSIAQFAMHVNRKTSFDVSSERARRKRKFVCFFTRKPCKNLGMVL